MQSRPHIAHADAWQHEGRLRAPLGGGAFEDGGARLSASGLPHAKVNSGDLVDLAQFDPQRAHAWYAARAFGAGVPWGLRVPAGTAFPFGRKLFTLRCMALEPRQFIATPAPPGVTLRTATIADLGAVADIDTAAFDDPRAESIAWHAPHLDARGVTLVLAEHDGVAVGAATAVLTDDRAGPSVTIFGVGVRAHVRRRGIGAAMTAWLVERGFDAGAEIAHLTPNDEAAARVYARLGFIETAGLDVYVGLVA